MVFGFLLRNSMETLVREAFEEIFNLCILDAQQKIVIQHFPNVVQSLRLIQLL